MNIEDVVAKKDWVFLIRNFLPVSIAVSYSFAEAMHIVGELIKASSTLNDSVVTDFMRDYAVNLMIILKEKFLLEWKKDWKNEAFLGSMCALVFRDEEAFKYIKNAYLQFEEPPQSLILAYISAGTRPGFPLTKQDICYLSHQAIKQGVSYETALQMASLTFESENLKESESWHQQALQMQKEGIHTPIIIPNTIKTTFDGKSGDQWGYTYEK
jgi:hypothetical protein